MKHVTESITFKCNNLLLKGVLHLPETENPPLVAGSHGLEGSKDSAKQITLSRLLPENGISFFRFDHRGCGQSQGYFTEETSIEKRAQDLVAAIQHLKKLGRTSGGTALFGSSLGGATCIKAWDEVENIGLKLSGAVICASPVQSRTIRAIPTLEDKNRSALPMDFFTRNLDFDLEKEAKSANHILILHGDKDEVVPVQNAFTIYENACSPKKLFILENADHRFSRPEHRDVFEKKSVDWFKECFNKKNRGSGKTPLDRG